ncbi:MAG: DUF1801 domain-containing protein [Acidimicrobiales bacterium]|nr:DUF1801 domain-containing protein [Acidimicrobiales bacterium]
MEHRTPPPSPAVADWLADVPDDVRECVDRLRSVVHRVAWEEGAWPLVEEIKWGQPSYRSPHARESTPLRLGWTDTGDAALLAHCQSRVIPDFRDAFGDRFRFEGNRAVLFGSVADVHEAELAELIRHALTYRRRRTR